MKNVSSKMLLECCKDHNEWQHHSVTIYIIWYNRKNWPVKILVETKLSPIQKIENSIESKNLMESKLWSY